VGLSQGNRHLALAPLVFAVAPTLLSLPLAPPSHPTGKYDNAFWRRGGRFTPEGASTQGLALLPVYSPPHLACNFTPFQQGTTPASPTSTVGGKETTAPPKAKVALFLCSFFCNLPLSPRPYTPSSQARKRATPETSAAIAAAPKSKVAWTPSFTLPLP